MKRFLQSIGIIALSLLFTTGVVRGATILYPSGGGTGTSTNPTYGQMLVGNAGGTYTLTATTSLGISNSGGSWGSITGTLSSQTDLQTALNAKADSSSLSSYWKTDGSNSPATGNWNMGNHSLIFSDSAVDISLFNSGGSFYVSASSNSTVTFSNFSAVTFGQASIDAGTLDISASGYIDTHAAPLHLTGGLIDGVSSITTGSIISDSNLVYTDGGGTLYASYFVGDGTGLTGITATADNVYGLGDPYYNPIVIQTASCASGGCTTGDINITTGDSDLNAGDIYIQAGTEEPPALHGSVNINALGGSTNLYSVGIYTQLVMGGTARILGNLGSVTAPGYGLAGDGNTGMWSSGADTLNFSTGGVERLRMGSTGSIGISTTTPWGMLSVGTHNLAVTTPSFLIASSSAGVATSTQFIVKNGNVGIGTTTPGAKLDVNGDVIIESGAAYAGQLVCYLNGGKLGHISVANVLLGSTVCVAN